MTEAYTGSDAATSSITVTIADMSHQGFYQCRAKSAAGELYSQTAQVTLHCKFRYHKYRLLGLQAQHHD